MLTDLTVAPLSDSIREDLNKVYAAARITSSKAYGMAQKALKFNEDMTLLAR